MSKSIRLRVGVKTDPIEYRYSYEWLFRIMAEDGVTDVQIGTFFELYQLPDEFFVRLRKLAESFGLSITSMFTSHRELGGFFYGEIGWDDVAFGNYRRLIEVGSILGARSVGSNPGAVPRDRLGMKEARKQCYLDSMKKLMHYACEMGLEALTMEPMSCLAEPPTLPDEIEAYATELMESHQCNPETVPFGFCTDVAHGYADRECRVVHGHMELLQATLPWLIELHLKNTDALFNSTFGFTEKERSRGIVDLAAVRDLLIERADTLPGDELVGYLEISGPKLGRDYSDGYLEASLRESLAHCRDTFRTEAAQTLAMPPAVAELATRNDTGPVQLAPSLMCADLCHAEESIRRLEELGIELLHIDLMDADFTPNMPLGLEIIKQLRPRTRLPFDVHLMVRNNDLFVEKVADIGVKCISVHAESCVHLERTLGLIQDRGIQAGVALSPATPLDFLDYVLHRLDFVLLMTVNPGFAGQVLVPSGIRKIKECRDYLDAAGLEIPIEVDGNVSFANIPAMVGNGADILVAGSSSVYHRDDTIQNNVEKARRAVAEGLELRAHGSSNTT